MSRINTNVSSQIAQRILGGNAKGLNTTLERLSTGLRINRGKDDPAGLIASENLRGEKSALGAAISNAERTDQLVNIAEGGLQEVSNLLTDLQGLITSTANNAGLSAEERSANQLQIDSILQTIDRIADSTNFQGVKLLNGNFDFRTSSVSAGISSFNVNGAKIKKGGYVDVQALITGSAQKGALYLSTGNTIDLGGNTGQFIIEVAGSLGSRQLSFASGTTRAQIQDAINTFSDVTGVKADTYTSGGQSTLRLRSSEYGSDAFVSVKVVNASGITGTGLGVYSALSGNADKADAAASQSLTSTTAANGVRDAGADVKATINGVSATTKGRTARVNTDFLDVELNFSESVATRSTTLSANRAFYISGGGAEFQLAGRVDIAGKVALGIQNISSRKVGGAELDLNNSGTASFYYLSDLSSGKSLNVVDGNLAGAQKVVAEAIRQTSSLRGRLGAFQKNTVGATVRSLNIGLENTSAAESVIRDADFASETASLTRGQILSSASTNVLGLANQAPQQVLQLLR
jgi:flagellin